jgi:hypothetical protein
MSIDERFDQIERLMTRQGEEIAQTFEKVKGLTDEWTALMVSEHLCRQELTLEDLRKELRLLALEVKGSP